MLPRRAWSGWRGLHVLENPAIAALQEPRRTATVAALFHTLETAAQDDATELAEALLTDLLKDAESADKKARLRSLHDLDNAAILLGDMARLVFEENALPLDQWRDALFEQFPRDDLLAAMAEVDTIARSHDAKPYAELRRGRCDTKAASWPGSLQNGETAPGPIMPSAERPADQVTQTVTQIVKRPACSGPFLPVTN
jgi:hypothetical protein